MFTTLTYRARWENALEYALEQADLAWQRELQRRIAEDYRASITAGPISAWN